MRTYLEYYKEEICPNIAELDIFLKTKEEPYEHSDVATILRISKEELQDLLEEEKFAIITKGVLFLLMEKVKTPFCQMISRELSHVQSEFYSVADIAYIYELPKDSVEEAIADLKLTATEHFTYDEIKTILEHIYIA